MEEAETERDGLTAWPERLLRFDLPSGKRTVLKENINNVQHLAIAPDEKSVATADALATIRFWDPSGEGRNEFAVLLGHADGVDSIAFSPSGAFLASGGRDGRVLTWKLEPGRLPESRLLAPMTEHLTIGPITGLRYSPNGSRIYAVDRYAAVLEWNALEDFRGERVLGFQCLEFRSPGISAFDVSPDGAWLAVAHDPGRALRVTRLYDLGTGELKHTLRHQRLAINAIRFTPDSRSLVAGGYGGGAVLWDLTKDEPEIWAEQEDPLWSVDVAPDGRWLACGDKARLRFVRVPGLNARFGRRVVALSDDFVDASRSIDITGLAFSPKGDRLAVTSSINGGRRLLITGGADRKLRVWDLSTGKLATVDARAGHRPRAANSLSRLDE